LAHPRAARRSGSHRPFPFETRLAAVKLHLEERLPCHDICEALGLSHDTLRDWLRRYGELGATGLYALPSASRRRGREQVPAAVKDRIVELKQANPGFGIRRISQVLARLLFLRASPETVRATLARRQLMSPPVPARPRRAPAAPRFFERSTPNQMWQSDITTFRIDGKTVYLVGFLDDYSRYLTGLGLYRSQTVANVLETYRRAAADYGPPKEMLTDNGRQYVAWRGKTRFQIELQRSGIHHIRATPHHPMTLGKIERFWQTLKGEFLERTAFGTFDEATERLHFWANWYNHRRPNQGIAGLCPADRYFEIRADVRKAMEQGMEENQLELALRGRPQRPFYMVGRLDEQSVVMQTRGGKLVMTVSDAESHGASELVCDLKEGTVDYEDGSEEGQATAAAVLGNGEVPGGVAGVDREAQRLGTGPGDGADLDRDQPVAGTGDDRDAQRPGAPAPDGSPDQPPEPPAAAAPGAHLDSARGGEAGPAGGRAEASGGAPGQGSGAAAFPVTAAVRDRDGSPDGRGAGMLPGDSSAATAPADVPVAPVGDGQPSAAGDAVRDLQEGPMNHEGRGEEGQAPATAVPGNGEVPGGAAGVDRGARRLETGPQTGPDRNRPEPLAGTGDDRDARGPGAPAPDGSPAQPLEPPAPAAPGPHLITAGQAGTQVAGGTAGGFGAATREPGLGTPAPGTMTPEQVNQILRLLLGDSALEVYFKSMRSKVLRIPESGVKHAQGTRPADARGAGQAPGSAHRGSPFREEDGRPGGGGAGGLPQDLVQVGEPGSDGHDRGPDRPADRAPLPARCGPAEAAVGVRGAGPAPAGGTPPDPREDPGTDAHRQGPSAGAGGPAACRRNPSQDAEGGALRETV